MSKFQAEFIVGTECTEERYYEMLGALPPRMQALNAFLVGEADDHEGEFNTARYGLYFTRDGKFFSGGLATLKDFRTFLIPETL